MPAQPQWCSVKEAVCKRRLDGERLIDCRRPPCLQVHFRRLEGEVVEALVDEGRGDGLRGSADG